MYASGRHSVPISTNQTIIDVPKLYQQKPVGKLIAIHR
jgi:hypothetical protein